MRVWSLLILALLLSILIGAAAGHDWMSPADLLRALAGDTDLRSRLLIDWRLPRVLAAACVGALLGLGGTVFQGVFRNPLGRALPAGIGRWRCARRHGGAAGAARCAAVVRAACARLRRRLGRHHAGDRHLARRRRRRCRRHAAGRRRGGRGAGRAAFVPDAGAVRRDGEPADRAELGAGRRADADLADPRPARARSRSPAWHSPCCWPAGSTFWAWARRWPSPSASTSIASSHSPCWRARSWSLPPSPSVGWSPSWVWPRRTSHAGWSDRCIGRCCRHRRWSAPSSSPWLTPSPDRHCRRPRYPLGLVTAVAGGPFFILLLARRLRT